MIKEPIKSPVMKLIWLCFALYVVILVIAMLSGCGSLQKKINKAKLVAIENPDSFADLCAKLYPTKDSVGAPIIKYIPADNKDYQTKVDSLLALVNKLKSDNDKDSTEIGIRYKSQINNLYEQITDLKRDYKKCVPDTVTKDIPIYRENVAKIKSLELELEAKSVALSISEDKLSEAEKRAKTRLWILIGIGVLTVAYVALKIKKIIPF